MLNYTSAKSESITNDLAKKLESEHGIRTLSVQADLADVAGPEKLIKTVKDNFSKLSSASKFQIDIIVNNAGVAKNMPVSESNAEDFDWMYHINVRGPLLLIKAAKPYLPTDRSGRIVNVSSVSATAGLAEQSIYGGTKAALEAMTRTWARELSEQAIVNAVNPGPVATDMWDSVTDDFMKIIAPWVAHTPLGQVREGIDRGDIMKHAGVLKGRPAYPHEIAGTVAMLCTPDAGFTTGSTICSNGGMVLTN